jgi:hypothetical protein
MIKSLIIICLCGNIFNNNNNNNNNSKAILVTGH